MTNNAYGTDTCLLCGDTFEVKSNRQMFCSAACRKRAKTPKPKERQGTCEGCQRKISAKGSGPLPSVCQDCKAERHRQRSRERHKATYKPRQRERRYQPGPVEGTELTFLGYDEENTDYGFFSCSCGNEKRVRLRYVFVGYPGKQKHDRSTTCGAASHRDKRMVEKPSIRGAHKRVTKARGSACEHPCAVCGAVTDNNQWAYRHSSYDPLVQDSGKDKGQVYSDSLDDYWSLCKRHHAQWDSKAPRTALSGPHVALALAYDPYGDRGAF